MPILLVSTLTPVKKAISASQGHFCAPDLEQISLLVRGLIHWFKRGIMILLETLTEKDKFLPGTKVYFLLRAARIQENHNLVQGLCCDQQQTNLSFACSSRFFDSSEKMSFTLIFLKIHLLKSSSTYSNQILTDFEKSRSIFDQFSKKSVNF